MKRTCLDVSACLAIVGMTVWFTATAIYTVTDPPRLDERGSVAIENALILASLAGMLGVFGAWSMS